VVYELKQCNVDDQLQRKEKSDEEGDLTWHTWRIISSTQHSGGAIYWVSKGDSVPIQGTVQTAS
jgi:hypothetical protein